MAKTKISEYDATAANNTDIDSINIAEGMAPSNVNNAIREMMAHLKDMDAGTQALTSPQLTSADINGGTIDGVTIGGSSAGAITGTTITGTSFVASGDMTFGDDDKAIFGAGSDLQIFHDGNHSYIKDDGTGNLYLRTEGGEIRLQGGSETMLRAFKDGGLRLYYDNAEKLRTESTGIDVSGTVTATKGSAGTLATFTDGVNSNFVIETASLITTVGNTGGSTALAFKSANSEAMRLTSDGSLRLGTTSNEGISNQFTVKYGGGGTEYGMVMRPAADTTVPIYFQNASGGGVGSISITASATAYNTSSDHRLKENVTDVTDGITRVKQLAPKRFNFIADPDTTVDGFLAHEAQAVVPEAVTGTHNEVDADGNAVMQGIDQSKLVPLLTAALQEAISKIETLETKVAALEGA